MKPIHSTAPLLAALLFFTCQSGISGDVLTLSDAVSRAVKNSPALAPYDADLRLADAKLITALSRPNPELEVEAEDILGSGEYREFDSAVYNIGISQLIEIGGKRKQRAEIARAGQEAEAHRYEAARREIIAETASRYVETLAAQAVEDNAANDLSIAGEIVHKLELLREGGRGSEIDIGQAELGKNEATLLLEAARRESSIARTRLAATWAATEPDFSRVNGSLQSPGSPHLSLDELKQKVCDHPALLLAGSQTAVSEEELALQEKLKKPDLTLGLGYRRDSSVDDNAVVLGFSLPLPLFNKNEGGIAEATATIEKSQAIERQTRSTLELAVAEAHARLQSARKEYDLITGKMLPAAQKQHRTLADGIELGRVNYLDLLEARRALNTVRKQQIDALTRYHSARVQIESLCGVAP